MEITIAIPADIATQLHTDGRCVQHRVLETIAVELYHEGASEEQLRRLLNFDPRFEVYTLLQRHGVRLRYTLEDLEDDRETLCRLGLRWV